MNDIDTLVLNHILPSEKFQIICRAKDIDIDEMAYSIYNAIEKSDYEDKAEYIGYKTIEPEEPDNPLYDRPYIEIDSHLLYTFDEWANDHIREYDISYEECKCLDWESILLEQEFSEEQKAFIRLALQCKVKQITIYNY